VMCLWAFLITAAVGLAAGLEAVASGAALRRGGRPARGWGGPARSEANGGGRRGSGRVREARWRLSGCSTSSVASRC